MGMHAVIAAWDGGERSPDALRFAAVAAQATGAKLVIAHAYDPGAKGHADERLGLRAQATEKLQAAERALPYGARASLRAVEGRSVVHALHELARGEDAGLIVVGATSRSGLGLHALGSTAERLVHDAPCAVAVAPAGFAREENPGLRVIGVAFDGSAEAQLALAAAVELGQASGAALKLIEVVDPAPMAAPAAIGGMYAAPQAEPTYRDAVRAALVRAADELPPELRAETVLADGEPAAELIERAGILSLLVMGSHGYGALRRALLGSVSSPLMRAAPCPVMVLSPSCVVASEVAESRG